MNNTPTVSVIITTYYRNDLLSESIQSVIEQTYNPVEIIVVDDSGERFAEQVAKKHEVKYVAKSDNKGQVSAWNTGVAVSTGQLLQFLDDDDILLPTKIEKQVSKFKSSEDVGVVYCGMEWESGAIVTPDQFLRGHVLGDVLSLDTSPCVTSTMLMKRKAVENVFPLPNYPASTDDILKIELAQVTRFDFVDEPLIIRGEGEDNVGSDKKIAVWNQILQDYANLYDNFPKQVYNQALANIYYKQGRILFKNNFWSIKARGLLLYAIFKSPEIDERMFSWLLRSVVGARMHSIIKSVISRSKRFL